MLFASLFVDKETRTGSIILVEEMHRVYFKLTALVKRENLEIIF